MLSSALRSGLLPSCRHQSLPLPHLPSRWLRKPRVALALLSPAPPRFPPFPGSGHSPWRLSEPWAEQVFPGHKLFHFQFAPSSFPGTPKLPPSPRREAPSSPYSGGPRPGPTHRPPSPPWEGLCTPSSLGGPVNHIPYPAQAWGHFPKGLRRRVGRVHLCAPPLHCQGGRDREKGLAPPAACGPPPA